MKVLQFVTMREVIGADIPGKLDVNVDKDHVGKLTVGMKLDARWSAGTSEEGSALPDAPLDLLDEIIPGVRAAIRECWQNDEPGLSYKRKPSETFVLDFGDNTDVEGFDDVVQVSTKVAYLQVTASKKQVKCIVRLVLVGVDPSAMETITRAYALQRVNIEEAQQSLPLSEAAK